jgi:dGTPase
VVVHNRLTHTLKVAQLARRLSEALAIRQPDPAQFYELDPEVTEAAALAHDLGHPPFGHIAETVLCALLDRLGQDEAPFREGFEGNAQSFRIVTALEEHPGTVTGLDLTRGTLDAVLKYPWERRSGGARQEKWGAYESEAAQLAWARALHPAGDARKSLEAELMDWADDVAYSVHDVEDFFQAGLIPLDRLASPDGKERTRFLQGALARLYARRPELRSHEQELTGAFEDLMAAVPFDEPFDDSRQARARLHDFSSGLITRYLAAVALNESTTEGRTISILPGAETEVLMLKQLTWQYVIVNPALAIEQRGKQRVITELFNTYMEAATHPREWNLFPGAWRERIAAAADEHARIRSVVDFIASLTEQQAMRLVSRIAGSAPGTILDTHGL